MSELSALGVFASRPFIFKGKRMSEEPKVETTQASSTPSEKNEVLEKASEVAKSTHQYVDQWGASIQKAMQSLGSYQAPVVVGILIGYGLGCFLTPALLIPPLALVVVTLIAKSMKS